MCFGCSKELSHRDGSFEYPQHMFWLTNKKNDFLLHTLIWGPVKFYSLTYRSILINFKRFFAYLWRVLKILFHIIFHLLISKIQNVVHKNTNSHLFKTLRDLITYGR